MTCLWDVIERGNDWTLLWECPDRMVRSFVVGSLRMPWEVAVDASCEFMDRYASSSLPLDILMDRCVRNSLRS